MCLMISQAASLSARQGCSSLFMSVSPLPTTSWGIIILINNNLLVPTTSRHFPSTKESKCVLLGVYFYKFFAPEGLYS